MSADYNILDVVKDAVTGNLEFASHDVAAIRRSICDTCEVRNPTMDLCTACGCLIKLKVSLTKSECPLGLW